MPTERPADDNLKGWPVDLRRLYGFWGWRRRARFRLREFVFEAPGQDACLLLFHVVEIGVCKEVGRLALYKNKERPLKACDRGRTVFWSLGDSTVQWSDEGRLAFVFECEVVWKFLDPGPGRLYFFLHVFDFSGGRCARWDRRLDGLYDVRRAGERRVALEPEEPGSAPAVDLNLDELKWRRF